MSNSGSKGKNRLTRPTQRGQALLEMALVLPIFLVVVMSIIDFGRIMHCWSSLNFQCVNAARTAAKREFQLVGRGTYGASTHTPEAKIREAFWRYQSPMMATSSYVHGPNAATLNGVGTASSSVMISASFDVELLTPVIGSFFGTDKSGTFRLSSSATESKE